MTCTYRTDNESILINYQEFNIFGMLDKEKLAEKFMADYQALRQLSDYTSEDFYQSYKELIRRCRGDGWTSFKDK